MDTVVFGRRVVEKEDYLKCIDGAKSFIYVTNLLKDISNMTYRANVYFVADKYLRGITEGKIDFVQMANPGRRN